MPTLSALRGRAAWFSHAEVNFLPTNTAVGHSTIATGTDPRIHGIPVINVYDRVHKRGHDLFAGMAPQALMASTLADVWQLSTSGKAIILAQGSINRAATPLAGHGACQINGAPVVLASYDESTGGWSANLDCFRLPDYLKTVNAKTLWSTEKEWLHHKIDTPAAVRRSALFPAFEADAMTAMIKREPLGEDGIPDLILLNYKGADFVGHRDGPDSEELRQTLREMDRNLARIIAALEAKVGKDYLLALTADHGMPSAPAGSRHLAPELIDLVHQKFDPKAKQLVTAYEPENAQMFVDENRLAELGLSLQDLARFIEAQPYIFAVFTQDDVRGPRR
jgi:Type I phosphodiesterase / nucleotide pyrophosphatase